MANLSNREKKTERTRFPNVPGSRKKIRTNPEPKAIQTTRAFCTMGQFQQAPADQSKARKSYIIWSSTARKQEKRKADLYFFPTAQKR